MAHERVGDGGACAGERERERERAGQRERERQERKEGENYVTHTQAHTGRQRRIFTAVQHRAEE